MTMQKFVTKTTFQSIVTIKLTLWKYKSNK